MSELRAIVLDFDGVLVESNEPKNRAFEDLADLFPSYRQAMVDYHLENYSLPRHKKFEHYVYELMDWAGDEDLVREMARQFSDFVVERVVACPFVPGAQAFLEEFYQRLPLYVSSVTPEEELRRIIRMREMTRFFVDMFGDPPRSKPDAIHHVISSRGLSPSQLLFVGDTASDYQVAMETGVEFIGRDSGQPFKGIKIDLFRDMREIGSEVRRRLSR